MPTRFDRAPSRRVLAIALFRLLAAARGLAVAGAALAGAQTPEAPKSNASTAPRFVVSFDETVSREPYTGRVFVMLSRGGGLPMNGPSWFNTQPFFGLDVKDWRPGEPLAFDAQRSVGCPCRLADLPAGEYRAQAVIDLNRWSHRVINAPGNGYSDVVTFTHDPADPPRVELKITQRVRERALRERDDVRYVKLKSRLLSEFYGRDVYMQAAVGLPDAYRNQPQRRFPALYTIPGFGGTIADGGRMARTSLFEEAGLEIVVVYLDPDCPTGHHVFADSANNGPRGTALIEELIPYLEQEFRLIGDADARYVTGHSSGGWASLWLQITYPDTFGGVWSTSPDPVDFSAFQTVNIYDPKANFFTYPDGSPRPIARGRGDSIAITARAFCEMEEALGRGGQLQSFEAVFSPRGPDGRPLKLWDRRTGEIDPKVAAAWRQYDIRHVLQSNWATLGPKLKGKLHLFCGDRDTFYLEGAFFKLRDALKELGSDAYVEVIEGAGHGLPSRVFRTVATQVAEHFERRYAKREGE